jgi:hypothetical protein
MTKLIVLILGTTLGGIVLTVITAGFGYIIGMAVAYLIPSALTGAFGITPDHIPPIFAWAALFIAAAIGLKFVEPAVDNDD